MINPTKKGSNDQPAPPRGRFVINADDWGRTRETTDRIWECVRCRSVSSVSAMVFMEDSERAAGIVNSNGIQAGLHLNLTTLFSNTGCASQLLEHQHKLAGYLRAHRFAPLVFNPFLVSSFEYVVRSQLEEYQRLYHNAPARLDGHHHIHLCSNVLFQRLLPFGTHVRRNFSFQPGEKGLANRVCRKWQDRILAMRHDIDDFFFALAPLEPVGRLEGIFSLAAVHTVEVETHPVNVEEYMFLTGSRFSELAAKFDWPMRAD